MPKTVPTAIKQVIYNPSNVSARRVCIDCPPEVLNPYITNPKKFQQILRDIDKEEQIEQIGGLLRDFKIGEKIDLPVLLALRNITEPHLPPTETETGVRMLSTEGAYKPLELFYELLKHTEFWKRFSVNNKENRKIYFTVFAPNNEAILTWLIRSKLLLPDEQVIDMHGTRRFPNLSDVMGRIAQPEKIVIKRADGSIDEETTKFQKEHAQKMLTILLSHIIPGYYPPFNIRFVVPPRGKFGFMKEIELPKFTVNGLDTYLGKKSAFKTLQETTPKDKNYMYPKATLPELAEITEGWTEDIGKNKLRKISVRTLTNKELKNIQDTEPTRSVLPMEVYFEGQQTQASPLFDGKGLYLAQSGWIYIIDNVLETL